jgi:hypothetical protein
MVRGIPQPPTTLARGPSVTRGTPIIVEEKKIGEAVIARPGAVIPGGISISLDTHNKVKAEVDKAASRGICPSIAQIASAAGLDQGTVNTHFKILELDEYGAMCSLENFCSHNACKSMLDKIHRWRGEA